MATKKISWLGYMDVLQQRSFTSHQLQIEGFERLLNINKTSPLLFSHSIPWIYLLDYTSGKYLMVSKSVNRMLGYGANYFLDGGLDLTLANYHPEHLRIFNEEIFPDRLEILKNIPLNEQADCIFSYSLQFKTKDGEYINLLQRNSFVKSDENGNPLLSLGVVINVEHYKEENPIIHLVEKINPDSGNINAFIKKSYFLHEEDKVFSRRELEVLNQIAEGLTSREIADKLFISEHTVINHKRSMHHKSNTQNSAALINFAFKQHLL